MLHDLGLHCDQYAETERLKAAGSEPEIEWGQPRFKRCGDRISTLLTITHDNTQGNTRFTGDRTVRIRKMDDIGLSKPFPVLDYRPKTVRLLKLADGGWRITIA